MTRRILIGDDNQVLIRSLGRTLQTLTDVEVDFASTPREVIDRAQNQSYDAVITELQYTETGNEGFDVLESIRDLTPVRILWTRAPGNQQIIAKANQSGANYVVGKTDLNKILSALG